QHRQPLRADPVRQDAVRVAGPQAGRGKGREGGPAHRRGGGQGHRGGEAPHRRSRRQGEHHGNGRRHRRGGLAAAQEVERRKSKGESVFCLGPAQRKTTFAFRLSPFDLPEHHSGLMPASFTTSPHFFSSLFWKARNSSGPEGVATVPSDSIRSCTSFWLRVAMISLASRSTTSRGILAGPIIPPH